MFQGVYTAIVTPFKKGKLDETSFRGLIEWQIQEGIHGIVVCGTTGEAATLSADERKRVTEIAVEQSGSRVPIIAGTGSNSTTAAIDFTKDAFSLGATASLQVTPYYNKPMQEGLYQHFKAIAEAVDIPIILYNVPGRTSVNMLPDTVARLSKVKNIAGLKEASGDLEQVKKIIKLVPKEFSVLSGEDAQNLSIYMAGGVGAISVTSNVMPAKVAGVWDTFSSGDANGAKLLQEELQPLNKAMFIETNPIPAKTALSLMGKIGDEFRLPITRMSKDGVGKLTDTLKNYKLI